MFCRVTPGVAGSRFLDDTSMIRVPYFDEYRLRVPVGVTWRGEQKNKQTKKTQPTVLGVQRTPTFLFQSGASHFVH